MSLLEHLNTNPFVLAPMAGITDTSFRQFMREMGCGPVITELVSASGIQHGNDATLKLMRYREVERPLGIQIFGETPEAMAIGAQRAESLGADFVDINFGCPVPKVVKKGGGSGALRDLKQLQGIVSAVRAAIKAPLTIKIRTGWTFETRNAHEVVHIAANEGVSWVAIHGRDRAQGYAGKSDWDYIAEVKSRAKVPIIGNGDIHTAEIAVRRMRESGCDGVMIGRGCLKNPYLFLEANALWRGEGDYRVKDKNFRWVFERMRSYLEQDCEERIIQLQLRKFAAWFSAGYPGASNFRKALFATKTVAETIEIIENYYRALSKTEQADTSEEAFLMGGHG